MDEFDGIELFMPSLDHTNWYQSTRRDKGNKLQAKEGNFDASVDETSCTSFGLFPTRDAVGANIDEALHLALEEAAATITPAINANPGSTAKIVRP